MTSFHRGRLVDHIHVRVSDLDVSKRFYRAVLDAVGIPVGGEGANHLWADELFLSDDGPPTSALHLAFQAPDPETVQRFHQAGLAAGGRDNGRPGPRDYHPGYYAAYLFDPDGNNLEAVFHGPASRSAPSVVIEGSEPDEHSH